MTGTFAMHAVLGVIGGGIGMFCLSFILYWKLLAEPHLQQKKRVKRTATEDQSQGGVTLYLQQHCR